MGAMTDFTTRAGTVSAIEAECIRQGLTLPAQIAYVLATVEHETNNTFKPVREAYWMPEWYRKRFRYYPYYGRGYVQLTWEYNYRFYGDLLGIDLLGNPDLAMNPEIACFVLVHGFRTGSFTGKKITDYINATKVDMVGARRCINGKDKAQKIAGVGMRRLRTMRA